MEVNRSSWPLLAQPLRALARPEDRGLGDVLAHAIGPFGGDAFKAYWRRTLGRSCGCEARQEALNARYPL